MITSLSIRMQNHDWQRTLREAEQLALDNIKADAKVSDKHIGWELLREAARVSRISYTAPPRTGFPSSSSLPDAPDDVTQWQLLSAYLKGELETLPSSDMKPSRPSAEQIDRADLILHLWHHNALARKGDKSRLKRAVYLKASGMHPQKIAHVIGVNTRQLKRAQDEAALDVVYEIEKITKYGLQVVYSTFPSIK